MDIGKLPMRVPAQSVALTLVLLRNNQDRSLRLWYGEGEAVQQEPTNAWDALKSHTKRRGHWQVWFWRRVFSAVELNNFVIQLETDHAIKTDHHSIPVELRERSVVLLPVGYHESLLSPVADQSAWLWELWDQEKKVQKLGSEEWCRWVNAATKEALGVDLGYWPDRIGNLAIFFPTGVVTDWNYDPVSQSAVIRTNLPSSELADHEIELEVWGGDEIVACERVQPRGTLVVFRDVPSPSRATIRVYQHGFLLHHDMAANVIKAIGLTIHVPEMVQNGRVYTRQAGGVNLGGREGWDELQTARRIALRRAARAANLDFKFYEPDPLSKARNEALNDLGLILQKARTIVRIWDPYFGSDSLPIVAGITDLGVEIRVLVSCSDWKTTGSKSLDEFSQSLMELGKKLPARTKKLDCRAWVRSDDTSFHDRFIMADDDVWMLGSSLNSVGTKHFALVRIEQADIVIRTFDDCWDQKTTLWGKIVSLPVAGV